MLPKKKEHPEEKSQLHPRNRHRKRYDFNQLMNSCPELSQYVYVNVYNEESIDFFIPEAVKTLNKALLKYFYDIDYWEIPENYLCPPIPGRADYIHHIADVLGRSHHGRVPEGPQIHCLDIGVGANCVYPIIGNKEYGWSFTGTDIDAKAISSANNILEKNPFLKEFVELRLQPNSTAIFNGIIQKDEYFDLCICNPPFHASLAEAQSGTLRKLSNLNRKKISKPVLNFGVQNTELWCQGGEEKFISDMVFQSRQFDSSCFWFSSLVSKASSLFSVNEALRKAEASEVKTIPMGQGNKISRIVAWTFLNKMQQQKWMDVRWAVRL